MPELPEVETVRKGLAPVLLGQRVAGVELRRAGLRAPFPRGFAAGLEGAVITGLRRRAKYILADTDKGDVWLTHLGMTGSFRAVAPGAAFTPERHDHVVLTLAGGTRLAFNDPRRFGQMDLFSAGAEGAHPALAALGPEPLDPGFGRVALAARLAGRKTAIKIVLLDQSVVAGVGNIYASEALYRAGIDPRRPAAAVTAREAGALARAIRTVLEEALESGGSTLRDYRQIDGNTGYFQHQFAVYGHKGETCPACRAAHAKGGRKTPAKTCIEAIVQGGRTTFFCPVKQR